jgi:hypothetical protein
MIARFRLYPASHAARRAWGNPSCYCFNVSIIFLFQVL